MTSKDNGGPAFPRVEPPSGGSGHVVFFGMTLRDYFAAKAMQGLLTALAGADSAPVKRAMDRAGVTDPNDLFARNAYAMADAMLKARGA